MAEAPHPLYLNLRERALAWQDPQAPMGSPSGVVVEIGREEGVSTLVVMSTGTVDLYFSHGAGIMGAGRHPGPAKAGRELAALAAQLAPNVPPALELNMPKPGYVKLYVLVDGIVRGQGGRETDFGEGRSSLSPLFHAAHHVMAEMRRIPPPAPDA